MNEDRFSFQEAYDLFDDDKPFDDLTHPLSKEMRTVLAKATSKLPKKVIEWVLGKVIFVSSNEQPAYCVSNLPKQFRGIIFLSDCLLCESEERQAFIIAHEIAHFKLKHKLAMFNSLTEEEIEKEQNEASQLAATWLHLDFSKVVEDKT
jgi:Zn-dependent peptidase ImmA (M78 family)